MREKKKVVMSILTVILLVVISVQFVTPVYGLDLSGMKAKADNFKATGQSKADNILPMDQIETKFLPIGQILVTVASIVLVIVTLIMAIKYLTANAEQKGKLKQQLIGLVVSVVVIYGAVGIWSIIKAAMESSGL